jgi:Lrp/AsnC family transcriptional regulator for asnA, asnC and gidA
MKNLRIDEINANILRTLLKDARNSFTEMAKENKITAAAVRSRYENLKKAGVITGAIMQINPHRIGFSCYGFLGIRVHPENVKEVTDYLVKQPYILATWNKIQEINIGNYFATRDLKHFTEITNDLKSYPYVKSLKPLIYVGSSFTEYPENLIIKPDTEIKQQNFRETPSNVIPQEDAVEEKIKKRFSGTSELTQMDKFDRETVRMLSQNARTPFSTIAKKLNMSTSHIIHKYKKLLKSKMFLSSSITIDPRKLGYQANAMVYVTISLGTKLTDIHQRILKVPNVIILIKTIGECDMLAVIPLSSFEELFEIEEQFRKIEGIEKLQFKINPPFSNWPFDFFAQLL